MYLCIKLGAMKYYRFNSNPLVPMTADQVRAGDMVYNELGKCVKKIYSGETVYFVEYLDSVLIDDEVMSDLTPLQLELFWKLSNSKLRKHEDKDKDSGR
jgi:hypothetical protein